MILGGNLERVFAEVVSFIIFPQNFPLMETLKNSSGKI